MLRGGAASRPGLRLLLRLAASLLLVGGGALAGFRLASVPRPLPASSSCFSCMKGPIFRRRPKARKRSGSMSNGPGPADWDGRASSCRARRDGERVLCGTGAEAGRGRIGGYFVIGARDASQAEEIASSCPHLRHGGSIMIRQIDRV